MRDPEKRENRNESAATVYVEIPAGVEEDTASCAADFADFWKKGILMMWKRRRTFLSLN